MNWLGRVAYRVVSLVGSYVPFWSRHRVRVVVLNDNDEVLLVKTWLSKQLWSAPGGGIATGEEPTRAAVRELKEETGLIVKQSHLTKLTTMHEPDMGIELTIFLARVSDGPLHDVGFLHSFEIIETKWWAAKSLPPDTTDYTKTAIRLALESKS